MNLAPTSHARRLGVAAAIVVAAITLAGAAPAALAHDALNASSPEEGTTVTELETVALTFGDTLLNLNGVDNAFVIQVVGPDDRYYETDCTALSGAVISAPVELGAAGTYEVRWQVVSADGHPISDTYSFEYAPTAAQTMAEGLTGPFSCGAEPVPDAVEEDATAASQNSPSGLVVGLLAGGGFIVLVGLSVIFLIRRSRRSV